MYQPKRPAQGPISSRVGGAVPRQQVRREAAAVDESVRLGDLADKLGKPPQGARIGPTPLHFDERRLGPSADALGKQIDGRLAHYALVDQPRIRGDASREVEQA